jgi:exosortase/archaeosortase family protein
MIVPATATLASMVLNQLGYVTTLSFQGNVPHLRAYMPGVPLNAFSIAGAGIDWPCSGIESLIIYTIVMIFFLRSSVKRWPSRIVYFVIGAVIVYFINILRIVTIFIIGVGGGNIWPFHDYYGPFYSIIWITSYPLIIIGSQMLWKRIRPAADIAIKEENQVMKRLGSANASSSYTAVKPESAGITSRAEKTALERLVKRGKIEKTEDERYFLATSRTD